MDLGGEKSRNHIGEELQFFGRLAERLRQKVEKAHFETWLSRLQCRGAKDGILEFIAPNAFTKDWIQKHYHDVLRETARSMDGRSWRILLYQGSDLTDSVEGHPCLGSFREETSGMRNLPKNYPQKPFSRNETLGSGEVGDRVAFSPLRGMGLDGGLSGNTEERGQSGSERDQGKYGAIPKEGAYSAEKGGTSQGEVGPFPGFPSRGNHSPSEKTPEDGNKEMNAPLFLSKGAPEKASDKARGSGFSPASAGGNQKQRPASTRKSSSEGTGNMEFFSQNSDSALNPGFTFENFVVGACNELTFAAAKAVAEFPGGPYNPLFIHGDSGFGKTHLLQGICHGVLRGKTPRRILYLSCENFINQFIQAVTNGNISDFRYNCRHVDMLLIDDIQMLEGKSRTQEEFFHTFNTLFNNQKQIVLSSDRAPKDLRTLQDRLISRFGWGMVTRLDSPCLETRVAIVKRKARIRHFELSDEVARFLAEHVDTNVRELEGAVTKLLGMATLMKRRIDLSLAEEILHDYRPSARRVQIQKIMEFVAREFGVQSRELQSKTRVHSVVLPRQLAILLARRHTRLSLKQIGGFFGDRNHATIMHSIKKAEQILGESEEIRERIQELTTKLLREA